MLAEVRDAMVGNHSPIEQKSVHVGLDGELLAGKFCAYCGDLNDEDAENCEHCGEYIADQGPDLRSRLARISRRGGHANPTMTGLIGADEDEGTAEPDSSLEHRINRLMVSYHGISGSWLELSLHVLALSAEVLLVYMMVRVILVVIFVH
jgi:hypothetical protein